MDYEFFRFFDTSLDSGQEYYGTTGCFLVMARKTLSISEEAYKALYRAKGKNESLTEAILRLAGRGAKGNLLECIRTTTPNNRLANNIERVLETRNSVHIRSAHEETVRKKQMTKAARAIDRLRESSKTPGWSGAERSASDGMLDGSRNLLLCCRNEVQHLGRDGRGLSRKERLRQGVHIENVFGKGEREFA